MKGIHRTIALILPIALLNLKLEEFSVLNATAARTLDRVAFFVTLVVNVPSYQCFVSVSLS